MQQALVVFARDRILGLAKVVGNRAVLQHNRARSLAEEVLHGAGEGVRGHGWKCLTAGQVLSVTSDHRHRQGLWKKSTGAAGQDCVWDNEAKGERCSANRVGRV